MIFSPNMGELNIFGLLAVNLTQVVELQEAYDTRLVGSSLERGYTHTCKLKVTNFYESMANIDRYY